METGDALLFGILALIAIGSTVATILYRGIPWLGIISAVMWFAFAYWLHSMVNAPAATYSTSTLWIFEMISIGMGLAMLFMPLYGSKKDIEEDKDEVSPHQAMIRRFKKEQEAIDEIVDMTPKKYRGRLS